MYINFIYVAIGEAVLIFIFIMLLIFMLKLHPQWSRIVIAKLRGQNLVMVVRGDMQGAFLPATYQEDTLVTKLGSFNANPPEMFSFEGTPTTIVYAPYARAINPRVLPSLRKIRALGIKSRGELRFYLDTDVEKKDEGGKPFFSQEDKEFILAKKAELQGLDGTLTDELETVRVQDVVNFLEEDNPNIFDSRVERAVKEELKGVRNPVAKFMPWIFMFMMMLITGAIAYVMVTSITHNHSAGTHAASATQQAAKSVLHM